MWVWLSKTRLKACQWRWVRFTSFPVMMSLLGLAVIFGLEKCRVPGGILLVIIAISIIGLIFDPAVKYHGLVAMPSLTGEDGQSLIFRPGSMGALQPTVFPSVLALVMHAQCSTLLAPSVPSPVRRICWIKQPDHQQTAAKP
ncbi:hypothetical protein ACLK2F_16310 [Escherichia coli]